MQREKSSPSSKATWTPETEIVVYLASVKKNKKKHREQSNLDILSRFVN